MRSKYNYIECEGWNMKSYITNIIMGLFVLMIFGVAGCGSRGTNATNAVPTASAGKVQNVAIGVSVTLDGGGSNDANKDLLTYRWTLASKPYGSSASLSSAVSAKPTFTPDIAGMYVFSLVVNDGTVSSAANAVIVNASVANVAPVANAGTDRSVVAGTLVTLDGSGSSDMNHDLLLFRWLLVSRPDGSTAVVLNPTVAKTTFTPDVAGDYVFNLVVNVINFS